MKRRVKYQSTNPYYSDEPAVARPLIADRPLVQNSALGTARNKFVDKHPGKMSGVAGFDSKNKPLKKPTNIHPPRLGAKANVPSQGRLRMSGHPKAHRLGGKI